MFLNWVPLNIQNCLHCEQETNFLRVQNGILLGKGVGPRDGSLPVFQSSYFNMDIPKR